MFHFAGQAGGGPLMSNVGPHAKFNAVNGELRNFCFDSMTGRLACIRSKKNHASAFGALRDLWL
jgi:hypothetical protein